MIILLLIVYQTFSWTHLPILTLLRCRELIAMYGLGSLQGKKDKMRYLMFMCKLDPLLLSYVYFNEVLYIITEDIIFLLKGSHLH